MRGAGFTLIELGPMKTRCRSGRAGFTLIELIVVILLISILLSVGAVALDGRVPVYALKGAARTVGAQAESVWSVAVVKGQHHALRLDLDQGIYKVLMPPPPGEGAVSDKNLEAAAKLAGTSAPPDLVEDEDLQYKLPERVHFHRLLRPGEDEEFADGERDIGFSPFGNEGSFILGLRYGDEADPAAGRMVWIKFNGITGQATYSDEKPEFRKFADQ